MTEGQKFDQGKPDWSLVPWEELEEVVKVLTHGKEKYGAQNWKLVPEARDRYFAAALRHLTTWQTGDLVDESGHHHLAHAACCILFLLWHERKELCQEDAAGVLMDRLVEDLVAGKEKLQDELDTLRRQIDDGLGEPILVREITDQIKFATHDPSALDRLTVRDVPEIERKAFGAVDKGKDSFKVKGIKFWRVV